MAQERRIEEGLALAEKGHEAEVKGNIKEACDHFEKAIEILIRAIKNDKNSSRKEKIKKNIEQVLLPRLGELKRRKLSLTNKTPLEAPPPYTSNLENIKFNPVNTINNQQKEKSGVGRPKSDSFDKLSEERKYISKEYDIGLELAEKSKIAKDKGDIITARKYLENSIELLLDAIEKEKDPKRKAYVKDIISNVLFKKLNDLKQPSGINDNKEESTLDSLNSLPKVKLEVKKTENQTHNSKHKLSKLEKDVIAATSIIGGLKYVPFDKDVDLPMEFYDDLSQFTDPENKYIKFSKKQDEHGCVWKRAKDCFQNSKKMHMIDFKNGGIDPLSIKQSLIGDCSFVSSISVCAYYEKKFKKPLISKSIFPQDKNGCPIYNPRGKYMVKLMLNGVWRKVIVDDRLPYDPLSGIVRCSYSTKSNEIWVSIVEKAFLKVFGGYEFPGSTGDVDLFTLTGWIPERFSIDPSRENFEEDKKRYFERMVNATRYGDCLITLGTGKFSDEVGDNIGLVSEHAYAVLRVAEVVDEKGKKIKLLMLKNPWSHVRWKGEFSPDDNKSWTPKLRAAVNYHEKALLEDNGIFWIEYDSLCSYFRNIYINWNPILLQNKVTKHSFWPKNRGPKKDTYNKEYNPQFFLTINSKEKTSLYILLWRHELNKIEELDDTITLHICDGSKSDLIYYDADYILRGVYRNSAFYLVNLNLSPGLTKYRLVVSQYEKTKDVFFTLKVLSPFGKISLNTITSPYKYSIEKKGAWSDINAGGPMRVEAPESFLKNPQYQLIIKDDCSVLIKLQAPVDIYLNVTVFIVHHSADAVGGKLITIFEEDNRQNKVETSGSYRPGFCYLELKETLINKMSLPVNLTVVLSTFESNTYGPYAISFCSTKKSSIEVSEL